MADSRQYWMDKVIRQVAEENMNPEVLSQDYRDPRFANRPMKPESKPYMGPVGGWLDAVMDKVASGARKVDKHVPRIPGSLSSEQVVRMLEPLRGRDVGATGEHEGDILPMNALMKAGLFPVMKFGKPGLKHIAKILGIGGDEAVDVVKQADQLKLPGTARTKKKKSEPKKEQKIDKLSRKARQEDALDDQGKFPQSPDHDRKTIGMSQKQYDDLIEGGWDHQKIMDEHEIVTNAKRREGAGPVQKVPKNPKPLTDKEYDLQFTLEESLRKVDELVELNKFERGKPYLKPEVFGYKRVFNYLEVEEIKKIAKAIGWRGPVNKKTEKAILEFASEKLDKLRKRSDAWNVDTHIKRNAKDQIEVGPSDKWGPQDENIFRSTENYGRDTQSFDDPVGGTDNFTVDLWEEFFNRPEIKLDDRRLLDMESGDEYFRPPTSKTKRKPFDEYTRDRSPESYINPGDTELQKEFAEIASAQRGAPEKIMLKITNTARGMEREYTSISEHIGDLYNRMTQPGNMAQSFGTITDKFKTVKLNLSPKSNATLPKYVKLIKEEMPEMVELLDEFADAHAAVDISTSMGVAKPVQLARDAAVAYGKLDLDEVVRLLKELEPYMEDYDLFKKAMFNFGR